MDRDRDTTPLPTHRPARPARAPRCTGPGRQPGARARRGPIAAVIAAAVTCAIACAAGACGASKPAKPTALVIHVPPRATTAGDALLEHAPSGADLVAEIDLARLRDNPTVGPAVTRLGDLAAWQAAWSDLRGDRGGAGLAAIASPLAHAADAVLVCSYGVGSDDAALLIIVRADAPRGAAAAAGDAAGCADAAASSECTNAVHSRRLAAGVTAFGPPAVLRRVDEVARGDAPRLSEDRALMRLRTLAMPERATGAAVRIAARLAFRARVAAAGGLEIDRAPRELSVWGDVADDLAVVAVMTDDDRDGARKLALALDAGRDRLIGSRWVRRRLLQFTLAGIDIEANGRAVRAVLVISPRRLRAMVARLSSTAGADAGGPAR